MSRLAVVADLTIEVGDDRGSTTAHLGSDAHGLVLEVPDPATLLRCVPGRGLSRDLPVTVPGGTFADLPVRLTSRGRDLGRVRLTPGGGVRLCPSLSGIPVLTRTALYTPAARVVTATALLTALAAAVHRLRRR